MQVRVIKPYRDKELGRVVTSGEVLGVTAERGSHLIAIGYAEKAKSHNIDMEEENA